MIPRLATRLRHAAPSVSGAKTRASVAILLRVVEGETPSGSTAGEPAPAAAEPGATASLERFLQTAAAARSSADTAEILFIKRAASPTDPWSGNVAFPGGRHEASDADDLATAVRETLEEVGLDLNRDFICLGRLDDRAVYARGKRRDDFALCPFVFVQTAASTPPLRVQVSEVQGARWVRVASLTPDAVDTYGIQMPFALVPLVAALPPTIKRLLGVETTHFPSLQLHSHAGTGGGAGTQGSAADSGSDAVAASARPTVAMRVAAELAQSGPPPAFNSYDDPSQTFKLWGLTMQATSDLLALMDRPRLNWPPIRFRNPLVNTFVYAICGGIELSEWVQRRRPAAQISPKHAAWAVAAVASPFLLLAALL